MRTTFSLDPFSETSEIQPDLRIPTHHTSLPTFYLSMKGFMNVQYFFAYYDLFDFLPKAPKCERDSQGFPGSILEMKMIRNITIIGAFRGGEGGFPHPEAEKNVGEKWLYF